MLVLGVVVLFPHKFWSLESIFVLLEKFKRATLVVAKMLSCRLLWYFFIFCGDAW